MYCMFNTKKQIRRSASYVIQFLGNTKIYVLIILILVHTRCFPCYNIPVSDAPYRWFRHVSSMKRFVALANPSQTASIPTSAPCSSSKSLYSTRFLFLGVETGLLKLIVWTSSLPAWDIAASRGCKQFPGLDRSGIVGVVVLSFPVFYNCLSDVIFEINEQSQRKSHLE